MVRLLRCTLETPVSSLLKTTLETLRSRTPISEAATRRDWKWDESIPVLNRENLFIGVLRHANLRRALAAAEPASAVHSTLDAPSGFFRTYATCLLALWQAVQSFAAPDLKEKSEVSR